MDKMLIEIAGRVIEIVGEASDPYFGAAGAHAASMSHLDGVLRSISDDVVIFDVGANIGLSAAYMAIRKPRARIYAFEAGPTTWQHLAANVVQFENVTAVLAAVSNEPGELQFAPAENAATSHVVGVGHMAPPNSITVPCIRLDDFAAEHAVAPALIKLDVEGHEPETLAGASSLIAAHRPLIHMEFNSWTLMAYGGHSPAAFAGALFDHFDVEGSGSALVTLHNNLLRDGCVSDFTMRLKSGAVVPTLEKMSFPLAARARIGELERRLHEASRGLQGTSAGKFAT